MPDFLNLIEGERGMKKETIVGIGEEEELENEGCIGGECASGNDVGPTEEYTEECAEENDGECGECSGECNEDEDDGGCEDPEPGVTIAPSKEKETEIRFKDITIAIKHLDIGETAENDGEGLIVNTCLSCGDGGLMKEFDNIDKLSLHDLRVYAKALYREFVHITKIYRGLKELV
jgi:hypothetical protein